jgi:hypothetical protein
MVPRVRPAFVDRELMPNRERFREQRSIDLAAWLAAGEAGFLGLGVRLSTAAAGSRTCCG